MNTAAVGFQCPECVREGNKNVRRAQTIAGATRPGDREVTFTLMGLSVLGFLVQQTVPGFTFRFALLGLAATPDGLVGVAAGQPYRLITAAFLHGSLLHLFFNMYALLLVGPPLERQLGRVRYLGLYFLSALGGSVVSYLVSSPAQLGVGASGAVFGLFAATLLLGRRLRIDTRQISVILGINLVFGFVVPGIDWRAHLGGLAFGALFATALFFSPRESRNAVQTVAAGALAVVILSLAVVRTAALTG